MQRSSHTNLEAPYDIIPQASLETVCTLRKKQRNILAIGTGETTNFIEKFGPNACDLYGRPRMYSRTKDFTEKYYNIFDEELCFIDTPESFELQDLYEYLIKFNGLDAILVFSDCYLKEFKLNMQNFFTASNYPREKIIYILTKPSCINDMKIMLNLQNKLMELHMNTKLVTNKNLFFIGGYDINFKERFRYALKNSFILQTCAFQLIPDPDIFKIIADVYSGLVEVLQTLTDLANPNKLGMFLTFLSEEDKHNVCKICAEKGRRFSCQSFEGAQSKNCQDCMCPLEEHLSLSYRISRESYAEAENSQSKVGRKNERIEFELERNAILLMMAIFYLFCTQGSKLSDISKHFNKPYWSLVKRRNISKEEPVFKEAKDKIKELDSYRPTLEEVTILLNRLRKEEWSSFNMKELFKDNCQLKFIANANTPGAAFTPSTRQVGPRASKQIPNNQKPLRFPEMKSNSSIAKEEKDDLLENLRKEVDELKISINIVNTLGEENIMN